MQKCCEIAFDLLPSDRINGCGLMTPNRVMLGATLRRPPPREGPLASVAMVEIAWPYAMIGVTARDQREFVLRLDCCGYPAPAPTRWLLERGAGRLS